MIEAIIVIAVLYLLFHHHHYRRRRRGGLSVRASFPGPFGTRISRRTVLHSPKGDIMIARPDP